MATKDTNRQTKTPATGVDAGNTAIVDSNLKVTDRLVIPSSETNTLNGGKPESGVIKLTDGKLNSFDGTEWTEYVAELDGLKEVGELELSGNDLTVTAPVKWRIKGVNYEKLTDTVINIPSATTGYNRIDLIYATTSGAILRIAGTETTGVAVEPTLPINTIRVAPVYIDGSVIAPPAPDLSVYLTEDKANLLFAPISGSDRYIQNNPSTYQDARIRLTDGSGAITDYNSGSLSWGDSKITPSAGFRFDIGYGGYFNFDEGGERVFHIGSLADDNYNWFRSKTGFKNGITIENTPTTSTSNYSILTRDNTSGEVKKLDKDVVKLNPDSPQSGSVNVNGDNVRFSVQTDVLRHYFNIGKAESVNDAFAIGSYNSSNLFSGFWRNFVTPTFFYIDDINGNGLQYKKTADYSNGGSLTLIPREYIDNKIGSANGIATLDSNGQIPVNQIPDSILSGVKYGGTYNGTVIIASTNYPELNGQPLPSASAYEGVFFIATASFTVGSISYLTGDWVLSVGSSWGKVDNTDSVISVNGRIGVITGLAESDGSNATGVWPINVTGTASGENLQTVIGRGNIADRQIKMLNEIDTYYGTTTNGVGVYYNSVDDALKFYNGSVGNDLVVIKRSNGFIGAGNNNPTEKIDVNGNIKANQYKLSALNTAPSSATDAGTTGEIRITAGYIYVCIATNTWVRSALTTW